MGGGGLHSNLLTIILVLQLQSDLLTINLQMRSRDLSLKEINAKMLLNLYY